MSGLLTAIDRNDVETVSRLLREGTDPDLVDSDGRTALMYSVTQGRDELVALLLQSKANPNARTRTDSARYISLRKIFVHLQVKPFFTPGLKSI